jgi:hypothetical protein
LLALFALSDDGFQIAFGRGVHVQRSNHRAVRDRRRPVRSGAVTLTTPARLRQTRTRKDVAFERRALTGQQRWPEWLPVALDLNYVAALAQAPTTKLVTLHSALEVVTAGLIGEQKAALLQQVGKQRAQQIIGKLRQVLAAEGVSPTVIDRVVQQAATARSEGNVPHLLRALRELGTVPSKTDVRLVVNTRNALVHSGAGQDKAESDRALELVTAWVHEGLKHVLESHARRQVTQGQSNRRSARPARHSTAPGAGESAAQPRGRGPTPRPSRAKTS